MSTGCVPGLLMSPIVIPSRMTIGPLFEMLVGKAASLRGEPVKVDVVEQEVLGHLKRAKEVLKKNNYNENGYESVISYGRANDQIFAGPIKVLLVEHHSLDKHHIRLKGAVDLLTKQPVSGGKNVGGGLRLGEMERDSLFSHGSAHVLKERLSAPGDTVVVDLCTKCKTIVNDDHRLEGITRCPRCQTSEVTQLSIPYAVVSLIRTLRPVGIETLIENEQMANEDYLTEEASDDVDISKLIESDEENLSDEQ